MADDNDDPLESVIHDFLESEQRGEVVDRKAIIELHPQFADSLQGFFAEHDRMKSAAGADAATVPPNKGWVEESTLPPTSSADQETIAPSAPSAQHGPGIGDRVQYFGDYELLEEIARGGMGVVFKAKQVNLNRTVALKMILAGQFAGKEDVQRFYTEAEAAAQLDHPGIVPIFEIGEHAGQHYFSMGYVEGESLAQRVADGPLPPREAADLVQKICEAMTFAHQHGVIHRDLKPANVLLDRSGQPRVTDFGLAKRTEGDSNLTGTGQILGTPAFMPPEQASGKVAEVGHLADVYSLGAVLYCLLTGRPPFQAASPMDTLMQVLDKDPLPPRQLNPSVAGDLQTITLKCLEKEPARRYQSASELSEELGRFLRDEPILARPTGITEKAFRWCRRNPALSGLLGGLAAAILAIMAGGYFAAYRMNDLRQAAENKRVEAERLSKSNRMLADQEAQQRRASERLSEKNRQQLIRTRLIQADSVIQEHGDAGGALPYYLDALRMDAGNEDAEKLHRLRINAAAQQIPRFSTIWKHEGGVNHLALDVDEKFAATSSHDRTVQVRRLDSGELVCPPLTHEMPVWWSSFSPDGETLVTSSGSGLWGELRFWSVSTGRPIGKPVKCPINPWQVNWTPQGNVVYAMVGINGIGSLQVMNPETREQLSSVSLEAQLEPGESYHRLHARAGRWIQFRGVGLDSNTLRVLDLDDLKQVVAELPHPEAVLHASFSEDGSRIATATRNQMFVWDVESGKRLVATNPGVLRSAQIRPSLRIKFGFTFDRRKVIVALDDQRTFVLDEFGNVSHLKQLSLMGDPDRIPSPSGKAIAFADLNGTLRVWDVFEESFATPPMRHSGSLNWARFTGDSRRILACCADGTVRVWDFAIASDPIAASYQSPRAPVQFADYSPDESELTVGAFNWVSLLESRTGRVIHDSFLGNDNMSVHVDEQSDRMSFGNRQHEATVLDKRSGQVLKTFRHDHPIVRKTQLSPDGKRLATISVSTTNGPAGMIGVGNVWDVKSGSKIADTLGFRGETAPSFLSQIVQVGMIDTQGVTTIEFSPDGRHIAYGGGFLGFATGSVEPRLHLRDLESGQTTNLPCGDGRNWFIIQRIGFSSSGRFMVSGADNPMSGSGSEIRVWDCESKKTIIGPLHYPGRVAAVEFSPDEQFVAVAVDDVVTIHDVSSGKEACEPLLHPTTVQKLSFAADHRVATAARDRAVRIWDMHQGRLLAPPIVHQHPVEDVSLLPEQRLMICSSKFVKIWKFEPSRSSYDQLVESVRLLTTLSFDDRGVASASGDQLMTDWITVSERLPYLFKASEQRKYDWYARMSVESESIRDWSGSAFYRAHLMKLRPDDVELWRQQVRAYGENGQFKEASVRLTELLKKHPDNGGLMFQLAHALLSAGEQRKYESHCQRFLQAHSDTEDPYQADQLGKTLLVGGFETKDDPELAHRLIDRAHLAKPSDLWFVVDKAISENERGNYEESIQHCNELIGVGLADIRHPTAYTIRALAKHGLGDQNGFAEDFRLARESRSKVVRSYSGIWVDLSILDRFLDRADRIEKLIGTDESRM